MLLRVTNFQYVLFVRSLEWFGLNTPSRSILTFRLLRSVRRLMTDRACGNLLGCLRHLLRDNRRTPVTTSVVAGQSGPSDTKALAEIRIFCASRGNDP